MKRTTKTITKGGFKLLSMSAIAVGISAVSMVPAYSASNSAAVTWVQPVNFALTAREPGGLASGVKINNKVILSALVNASVTVGGTNGGGGTTSTNAVIVSIPSTDTLVTNPPVLNTNYFKLTGTNGIFDTNGTLVLSNFPATITATNIIATVGTNSTTNTITLDESTNNPPSYTFTNFVTFLSTNGTGTNAVTVTNKAFIFTNAFAGGNTNFASGTNADYITAVLQVNTNGTSTNQLVWSFEASYLTNVVSTSTNGGGGTNVVNVNAVKGDSLVLVTVLPPTGTTPSMASTPPVFALSHGKGATRTLTDLSAFLSFVPNTNSVTATSGTTVLTSYGLTTLLGRIDAGGQGTPLSFSGPGFYKETDKNNTRAGGAVPSSILTTDLGDGAAAGTTKNFVYEGTVNATGGSTSSTPLTTP